MGQYLIKISLITISLFIFARISWKLIFYEYIEPMCDPILASTKDLSSQSNFCLYPFPNDFYLKEVNQTTDESINRYRVNFSENMFPSPRFWPARSIEDATPWNRRDGWSASSFIGVSGFSEEISIQYSGLKNVSEEWMSIHDFSGNSFAFASHMDIGRSLDGQRSPTLIVDAETGELVPHYVEVDFYSDPSLDSIKVELNSESGGIKSRPERNWLSFGNILGSKKSDFGQNLILWPHRRLKNNRRYIIAIRNIRSRNRKDRSGQPELLDAPFGFQIIRDDLPSESDIIAQRKQHFKERRIFEILENYGYVKDKSSLYLAWDFTTASLMSGTEHLRFMRDEGLKILEKETSYGYNIKKVEENVSKYIYRKIEGTFSAPLYLETEKPSINSKLRRRPRNEANSYIEEIRPIFNRLTDVPFTIYIPWSAVTKRNASIIQYGHGLFGSQDEARLVYLHKIVNIQNSVLIAADWWGLQSSDLVTIARIISLHLGDFSVIPDRCSQAILNQLLLTRLVRRSNMWRDENVFLIKGQTVLAMQKGIESSSSFDEALPVIYYGNSLGGILGSVYLALTDDVKTSILGVPGTPFSMVLQRNQVGHTILHRILNIQYPKASDRLIIQFLMHQLWEMAEPSGYTDALEKGGILSTPGVVTSKVSEKLGKRKLLIQLAVGDTQVSTLGGRYFLRSIDAGIFARDPYEQRYLTFTNFAVERIKPRKNSGFDYTVSYLPYIEDRSDRVYHTVATSFHYRVPWTNPFFNLPPTLKELAKYNTHDWVRFTIPAVVQQLEYLGTDAEQRKSGKYHDDFTWAESPCLEGCWNNIPWPNTKLTFLDEPKFVKQKNRLHA